MLVAELRSDWNSVHCLLCSDILSIDWSLCFRFFPLLRLYDNIVFSFIFSLRKFISNCFSDLCSVRVDQEFLDQTDSAADMLYSDDTGTLIDWWNECQRSPCESELLMTRSQNTDRSYWRKVFDHKCAREQPRAAVTEGLAQLRTQRLPDRLRRDAACRQRAFE